MPATAPGDLNFVPQTAAMHINAYFERQMGLGKLAVYDATLESTQRGDTATFPFWNKIGDAETPDADDLVTIDKMTDDKFSVTVKEIAKGVGWKDAAKMKSGATKAEIEQEVYRQIGQVFAEKVDKDLVQTLGVAGNYVQALTGVAGETMNMANYVKAKILGFGDKSDQAIAVAMHSLQFMDLVQSNPNLFKDATHDDPFFGAAGYQGRVFGNTALFVFDSMPRAADIGGKKAFDGYILKANPFGIYWGQHMNVEKDRDIQAREDLWVATGWYGTLGLNQKVSADDKRVARFTLPTSVNV